MADLTPVFVYGSLRKGQQNNYKLAAAEYKGLWETTGKYYMIGMKSGAYPYVTTEKLDESLEPTKIVGELYCVAHDLLCSFDEMEGHPTQYKRILLEIKNDKQEHAYAFMYLLESDEIKEGIRKGFARRFVAVNNGDWVAS